MLYLPAEFPQESELCYLNHAAVAPWPKRAAEAVQRFAFENMTTGAERYPSWMEIDTQLRERLAWLLDAPSADDIALVKNTSEGLSMVAAGLDWQVGDQVVGIADDFPSNRVVWEALADRGVEFISVDCNAQEDPEAALLEAITPKTRLLALSSVHFATGVKLDLRRISAACRECEVLLCVDAIQSLGARRFNLSEVPADFVVADGHKWMLGPEGLGVLYVRPELRESLRLSQFGWAMRENRHDFSSDAWQPAHSARRFECGSPNMLGAYALNASLGLLQEVGWNIIEERLQENTDYLIQRLQRIPGCSVRTPNAWARRSGIVSFRIEGIESDALYQALMRERVICASRGGFVRFSPHFYTPQAVLDQALEKLSKQLDKSSLR